MPGCAAIGCNNRSEKGYTMKCFPRDPDLRKIWKQRVGRADWEPSNNSFLCHVHFEPNQWIVTPSGRIKLKKGALPSIFTVTSTRKSPKKRQKLKLQAVEEENLEEYEVEYLETDSPFIINMMNNQKDVPNIINVQSENLQTAAPCNGQIFQNVRFITGDALKDLQNENVIIVADEHNREIGKLVSDNGFLLLGNERGKENVQNLPKPDKSKSIEVKLEVKEEIPENTLSAHDYDEIERKLKEICHSESEADNNKDSPKRINNQSIETESSFSLDDLEDGSDSIKENSSRDYDPKISSIRTGIKRKRKIKIDSLNHETTLKTSQSTSKKNDITKDVTNIINDLETENSLDDNSEQSKCSNSIKYSNQANGAAKPIIKNDIHLKFIKNFLKRPTQLKKNNVRNVNRPKSCDDLNAKINVQGEVIEKLTSQLIMYKDMERKMQSLTKELENKNREIEVFMYKASINKSQTERKISKSDSTDLKDANETDLKNRIDFLEDNNKKLMKNITLENQNRRKLEYQVKNRDNQIKELNWKLEKASKFLDRAEKNANNYRKKMSNMQSLIRRKKLLNEKSSLFDQFLVCQSNQQFSEITLKIALEILKVCGMDGYEKLLSYEFPLPSLKDLSNKYPTEINYNEPDEEELMLQNRNLDTNINEILPHGIKMEKIEVLECKVENLDIFDTEIADETEETITGTVQDIFNENSDCEDFSLNELKKHIMFELGTT